MYEGKEPDYEDPKAILGKGGTSNAPKPSRRRLIVEGTDLTLKRIAEIQSKTKRIKSILFGTAEEKKESKGKPVDPGFFGSLEMFGRKATQMLEEINESLGFILEQLG